MVYYDIYWKNVTLGGGGFKIEYDGYTIIYHHVKYLILTGWEGLMLGEETMRQGGGPLQTSMFNLMLHVLSHCNCLLVRKVVPTPMSIYLI